MKVLVTGGRGQVAWALEKTAPQNVEFIVLDRDALDVSQEAQVAAAVREREPDLIINAAAYTAVDRAEAEEPQAHAANASAPGYLANAAAASGARLIHISTDYVFDGESTRPYTPHDQTGPLGVYGRTKLAGERAVLDALPERSVVLRTAWVYSPVGHNFVRTMLRLMAEKGAVRVVADQIGAPTAAESIAAVIWRLAEEPNHRGILHWVDAGVASWYDFAVAIAEEACALNMLSAEVSVTPITTAEYPTPARRPRFSLLDSRATRHELGLAAVHWRVWLRRTLMQLKSQVSIGR